MKPKNQDYEKKIKKVKNSYQEKIGKNLKLARNTANMTQAELAEEIEASVEHISNMERGQSYGSIEMVIKICNALNISANFLFEGLIINSQNTIDSIIDNNFAEKYLKLTPQNKKTINTIISALVNDQKNNNLKQE